MIPAVKIVSDDIGKEVHALVRGKYIRAHVVSHHKDYVVYCIDSGRYENASMKYALLGDGAKRAILDVLKEEEGTVYPTDVLVDKLYDSGSVGIDYDVICRTLSDLVGDETSGVKYHQESDGWYVDTSEWQD